MRAFALLLVSFCCNGSVISTTLDIVRPQRRDKAFANIMDAFFPQDVQITAEPIIEDLHILPSRLTDYHEIIDVVPKPKQPQPSSAESLTYGAGNIENEANPTTTSRQREGSLCTAYGDVHGVCYSKEACQLYSGRASGLYGGTCKYGLVCCTFEYTCGDAATESSVLFRSPGFPHPLDGTLACDFDMLIKQDACIVRVDFEVVQLARRLGGVCDLDQLIILNSADGPMAPLCGPMSNFTTYVAVQAEQARPLKIAVIVQGTRPVFWQIRLTQLSCTSIKPFKAPTDCGKSNRPSSDYGVSFEDINNLIRRHGSDGTDALRKRSNRRTTRSSTWANIPTLLPKSSVNSVTAEDRIIGGEDAQSGEFPWQVAILLEKLFFCGGAVISEHLVLTAAHCLITRDTPVKDLRVISGVVNIAAALDGTAPHQERSVTQVVFHSHFHPFLLDNDIAMLRLKSPFTFTDLLSPVCLPRHDDAYANRAGWVAGWGVSSFPSGEPSAILQRLRVMTLSTTDCSKIIDEPIGAGMLCAAPLGREGTCFGDSGGPLTVDALDGRSIFVGIVSFGVTGCAAIPAFPDVYTRVSAYLHWIDVSSKI